jgi:hypothetical protein
VATAKRRTRSTPTEASAHLERRAQMKEILQHIERLQEQTRKILALVESDRGKPRPSRRKNTRIAAKPR